MYVWLDSYRNYSDSWVVVNTTITINLQGGNAIRMPLIPMTNASEMNHWVLREIWSEREENKQKKGVSAENFNALVEQMGKLEATENEHREEMGDKLRKIGDLIKDLSEKISSL